MALQHFYSRVPARMSLFHKVDGYDTFSCSAGIDQSFIETELLPVCEDKLSAADADLARREKLAPAYMQFCTSDGRLVQSCISYLPRDYSGERSAYLVHSLIYDAQETETVLSSPDGSVMPCDLFCRDLSAWNVTDPAARPDTDYPTAAYRQPPENDWQTLISRLGPDCGKPILYAFLSSLCGKSRSVFVCSESAPAETSGEVLNLIHTVLRVVPYHLRPLLSFCTRVGEQSRFQGMRVRGVTGSVETVQTARGVRIDLTHGAVLGIPELELSQNAALCNFFWSLYRNDTLRREFLLFTKNAVKNFPPLGLPSMKNLTDLVYLFRCGSGLYQEKVVLPNDDAVLELFTVYEKYRDALPEEYRLNTVKSLRRYAQAQTGIPKKLFTKVTKLYPGEPACVRHLILTVVLELIHTDAMRDRLFAFLKGIYDSEEEATKGEILHHLCSVYYGGFLQQQILAFFDANFAAGHFEGMEEILEKLLLTIRTKAVQDKTLEMIDRYEAHFTPAMREAVGDAVLEHLPEGDSLAAQLLALTDRLLPQTDDDFRTRFLSRLCDAVDEEQKRTDHPMFRLIVRTDGICARTVGDRILRSSPGKRIFGEYIGHLCTGTPEAAVLRLLDTRDRLGDLNDATAKKLADTACRSLSARFPQSGLSEWVGAERAMNAWLSDHSAGETRAFADRLRAEVLLPAIGNTLCNVFTDPDAGMSPEEAEAYAAGTEILRSGDAYATLRAAIDAKAATDGDPVRLFRLVDRIRTEKPVAAGIAAWLRSGEIRGNLPAELAAGYLAGRLDYSALWETLRTPEERTAEPKNALKKQIADAEDARMQALLTLLRDIGADAELSEGMKKALSPATDSLRGLLVSYVGARGKREAAALCESLTALFGSTPEIAALCEAVTAAVPKQHLFARLFGRK